jgi:hypothetical protein
MLSSALHGGTQAAIDRVAGLVKYGFAAAH